MLFNKLGVYLKRKRVLFAYTGLALWFLFAYGLLLNGLPDNIYVSGGKNPEYAFGLPVTIDVLESEQTFAVQEQNNNQAIHYSDKNENTVRSDYILQCKLFGLFPVKQISVQEKKSVQLLPAGTNIGIYVKNEGVMVIGTGELPDLYGNLMEPAKNIVQSGDYILSVNGLQINGKTELTEQVAKCSGQKVTLGLLRNGKHLEVRVKPVQSEDGNYYLGIWVRDDIAGVGTLTYINEKKQYGALGHGVMDMDVGQLLDVKDGRIFQTRILGIRKGVKGQPGEMSGMINYDKEYQLGSIEKNTNVGIYGNITTMPKMLEQAAFLPIGYKEEIKKQKAQIISSVAGERKKYEIEIEQIDYHSEGGNKGIRFKVTDSQLLADTGGIVQGMSGSPIIQDGKMIGAVTHVLVSDPTRGYGIFIETMLEQNEHDK